MSDSTRRDFLQGTAVAALVAAGGVATAIEAAEDVKAIGAAFDQEIDRHL
jgi:hypothetical protein